VETRRDGDPAKNLLVENGILLAYLGTQSLDYSCISPRVSVSPRLRVQNYGTLPTFSLHKGEEVIEEICCIMGAG
jgi:hypothetical protein